jgi:hypothetical protein
LLVIVLALWGLLRLPLAMPAVLNALAMLSTSMEGDDGFKFGAGKITRLGYARYRGRPARKAHVCDRRACILRHKRKRARSVSTSRPQPLRVSNYFFFFLAAFFLAAMVAPPMWWNKVAFTEKTLLLSVLPT